MTISRKARAKFIRVSKKRQPDVARAVKIHLKQGLFILRLCPHGYRVPADSFEPTVKFDFLIYKE